MPLSKTLLVPQRRTLLTAEVVLDDYRSLADRLRQFPRRTMLRIPIQQNGKHGPMDDPRDYVDAFRELSRVADIMIQFADSQAMGDLSVRRFKRHVKDCLHVLRSFCTVAEAGNEVNGDWLGSHTADKVRSALSICHDAGIPAAVTYYLSAGDEQQMFEWIDHNPMASDYVLVSYYPNSTPGRPIDPQTIFRRLSQKFVTAGLGWGEYGTENADGSNTASIGDRARLVRMVEQQYWAEIAPLIPNYFGFGGYWDWASDEGLDLVFKEVWGKE